jgi:hypothetical protein
MSESHQFHRIGPMPAIARPHIFVTTCAFLLVIAGCGVGIQESKLMGSWEDRGMPGIPRLYTSITNTIYTFNQDRTVVINHLPKHAGFGLRGTWKLRGNRLVMTLTEEFETDGSSRPIPKLPPFSPRITKFNGSRMMWGGNAFREGLELNRVNIQSPARER